MNRLFIILIFSLLNLGCSSANETITELSPEDKEILQGVDNFIESVLGDKKRHKTFMASDKDMPYHNSMFENDGLETVTTYSNKDYPRNVEPSGYEHFTLFVFFYDSGKSAKEVYKSLINDLTTRASDHKNLSQEDAQRMEKLQMQAKPGGFFVKKGRYIFSLVKTCRGVPGGGDWLSYESKFIKAIYGEKGKTTAIVAECGAYGYKKVKRTAN